MQIFHSLFFSSLIACVDDEHFHEKRQGQRDASIGKLLIVLRHCLLASQTGRHIIDLGTEAAQVAGAPDIVSAVVGVRSPATLLKRANSLLSFLRWVAKEGIPDVNPFVEQIVWRYMSHLKETGAPATKGASAMSSFRFAHHVLGYGSLKDVVESKRLIGISDIMLASKRCLRQSLVLTVNQVVGLHRLLRDRGLHRMDKAMVGYLLIALYGRCRHSDLQSIHSVECDFNDAGGYILIQTCCHKTGRMAALKSKLLPIMIPARGVDGSLWADEALAALDEAGVSLASPIDGPLVRAPAAYGITFMKRGLRSNEVSALLRRFIGAPDPIVGQAAEVVSSHSLKSTALSWCARYGLSPSSRSLLGRHVSSLTETYAIYSRDLACAPVAELQKVIDAIHDGSFMPDNQRSEFFLSGRVSSGEVSAEASRASGMAQEETKQACTVSGEAPKEPNHGDSPAPEPVVSGDAGPPKGPGDEVEVMDEDSSDSSSRSSYMSSDDSEAADPPARVKRFRARIPKDERWYVHNRSHLIHRYEDDGLGVGSTRFLVCGKRLTEAYVLCTEATAWNTLCKSCCKR